MKQTFSFDEYELQVIADYLFNAIDEGVHTISMTHEAVTIREILKTNPDRYQKGIDTCNRMLEVYDQ